jgi:hypothetical protein
MRCSRRVGIYYLNSAGSGCAENRRRLPAVLMHFISELSAEEADALYEAYQRLTGHSLDGSR